MVKLYVFFNHN